MGKQWKQHQTLFFWCLCKETQPVHSKGDQSWVFFGSNYAKAEGPILWPLHATSWFIGKDSDAGRDWGQEKKGMTEDEMAGWPHWLDGHEFGWTPGVGDGQGGLACCDSWGCKESDTTEQLNWTEICVCFWTDTDKSLKWKVWKFLNTEIHVYKFLYIETNVTWQTSYNFTWYWWFWQDTVTRMEYL